MYNSFIGCSGCGTSVYTQHWLPWTSHQYLHVWHTLLTSWWMLLLWGPNPSQWEHGWNHIHPFVPPTHCPSRLSISQSLVQSWLTFHFHTPLHSLQISSCYGHEWMWELDHKEGWAPKKWCFQIVMSEKTLESPLDSKEIKPVNPRRNQHWIFIGRTDAETLIL